MRVVIKPGDWFGYRQVIRRKGSTPKSKASRWLVHCTGNGPGCKREHLASAPSLNSNDSCGCLRGGRISQANTRHGLSKEPVYKALMAAINRCRNRPEYKDCVVFEGWLPSTPGGVQRFFDETNDSYFEHAHLDRYPNRDGNYEPGNWRWATHAENISNCRDGRTPDEVRAIRKDTRFRKDIANEYECSIGVIARIQKGESYGAIL